MVILDVILALVIALILGGVFALAFGRPGPWADDMGWGLGLAMFFLLIFLASWGGGLWIGPVGPPVAGVYWLAPLVIGLIVAMLLAAAPRPYRGRPGLEVEDRTGVGTAVDSALIVFFWVTAVLLIGVVVLGILA